MLQDQMKLAQECAKGEELGWGHLIRGHLINWALSLCPLNFLKVFRQYKKMERNPLTYQQQTKTHAKQNTKPCKIFQKQIYKEPFKFVTIKYLIRMWMHFNTSV